MTGLGFSCGACKFLRRKCTSECAFAPYFCFDQAANHFAAVHRVFGASNVSKLLLNLPVHRRSEAAITISYEALARMHDPVYGCFSHIYELQQQVAWLQEEIDIIGNQIACNECSQANNIPNIGLYSQTSEMSTDNHVNQQIPLLSHVPEDQEFYSQMNMEFPKQMSNVCLDSDLPESLFQGINQEIFPPYVDW